MTTLSDAANAALTSLTEGGLIEEYQIDKNGRRVKRGSVVDQVEAAMKLQAIANRQAKGTLMQVGVFTNDR
jgi:hypothetical protein